MQLLSYSSQQTRISEIVIEADNVDTSMLSLLIHMFEDSFVLTMLSKNILCLVEQCLGLWITSCKAHDAQLKVLGNFFMLKFYDVYIYIYCKLFNDIYSQNYFSFGESLTVCNFCLDYECGFISVMSNVISIFTLQFLQEKQLSV